MTITTPYTNTIANIFAEAGMALALAQSIEAGVDEALKLLAQVNDIELTSNDTKSHYARLNSIKRISSSFFSNEEFDYLHECRKSRNELAHTLLEENAFLLFTENNRSKMFNQIKEHRMIQGEGLKMFSRRNEAFLIEQGADIESAWNQFIVETHS